MTSAKSSSPPKTSGECRRALGGQDEGVTDVVRGCGGRLEEMEATVKVMDNASKINDWVAINNGEEFRLPLLAGD